MFKNRTLISGTREPMAGGSSEPPPSALAVVESDDTLTEILLRLPVIALLLFKSVSKRWLSLITDPSFTLRRSKIPNLDPPSGIFLWRHRKAFYGYDFVPFDTRIPAYRYPSFNTLNSGLLESTNIQLLHACNGLLLLCIGRDELHVYNPSMNLLKKLPEFHGKPGVTFLSSGRVIAFDPTISHHYKVVNAGLAIDHNPDCYTQLRIYSSETRNWNVYDGKFCIHLLRFGFGGFERGIYLNGSLHWLNKFNGRLLLFKFHLESLAVETIKTPKGANPKLFESRGCLVLASTVFSPPHDLNVYMMNNEFTEWLVKYTVKLEDIMWMFPKTKRLYRRVCSDFRCIVVGERDDDSFLVIERDGMVLRYKFASKTLHHLHDLGSKVITDNFRNFQFIASFAAV